MAIFLTNQFTTIDQQQLVGSARATRERKAKNKNKKRATITT